MSKYTKETFAIAYAPLKAENLTDNEIIKRLNIARATFYKYKKEYDNLLNRLNSEGQAVIAVDRAERAISKAYDLHDKGIDEAIKNGQWDKAREIAIEQLKVAKTESDIRRVFASVHIDARTQTINILTPEQQKAREIEILGATDELE